MGWNEVHWHADAAHPLPAGPESHFYFVHSYVARPRDASLVAATADYGGPFCAAVARGRLLATQFHPEKSQDAGMDLLRAFLVRT